MSERSAALVVFGLFVLLALTGWLSALSSGEFVHLK